MVSEKPQPVFFRARFPSTLLANSSPEAAPQENPRDKEESSVSSREPWQRPGGVCGGKKKCWDLEERTLGAPRLREVTPLDSVLAHAQIKKSPGCKRATGASVKQGLMGIVIHRAWSRCLSSSSSTGRSWDPTGSSQNTSSLHRPSSACQP